ncbi:MAG TPA: response regulator [Stellaceae bacterium]|jgi:CheY-like chemotaxis protein|nr:response regulator [Stellaceae bacterium]
MALILVIDDQDMVRFTVRRMLASKGHEVIEAATAGAGIALCRERRPALVMTDMIMPDKAGADTIAELRRSGGAGKILAMSGGADLEAATQLGADAVLEKPFRAETLFETVTKLIG